MSASIPMRIEWYRPGQLQGLGLVQFECCQPLQHVAVHVAVQPDEGGFW